MFERIREDIRHYYGCSGSENGLEKSVIYKLYVLRHVPSLKALMTYRLGCYLKEIGTRPMNLLLILMLKPVFCVLTFYYRSFYDIKIEQSAEIGSGFYIAHFAGIRLQNCRIGKNCSIHHELNILPDEGGRSGPVIGERVWIGPHVRIQGRLFVGDGSTIGAGALVTRNIAGGCLVMGNPARVVSRSFDNTQILKNYV